jgi:hypothetical protein
MALEFFDSCVSCGIMECSELHSNPEESAYDIACELYLETDEWGEGNLITGGPHSAMLLFSDAVKFGRGVALADFLRARRLGLVTASPVRENPNTGNEIQAWIFCPNHEKFRRWALKRRNKE